MNLHVIAHRGMGPTSTLNPNEFTLDTLPENSVAAFKYAFRLGADGIEFDVHVTRDDKVAVIHDDLLNRKVYGAGLVNYLQSGRLDDWKTKHRTHEG